MPASRVHPFLAATVVGYFVWGKYSSVNYQICMYLLSRVIIALVRLASERGWPVFKDCSFTSVYPPFAALTWGAVLYLFEYHPEKLHPSLTRSMEFLYHQSNAPSASGRDGFWTEIGLLLVARQLFSSSS